MAKLIFRRKSKPTLRFTKKPKPVIKVKVDMGKPKRRFREEHLV